jgi:hypothetical protein
MASDQLAQRHIDRLTLRPCSDQLLGFVKYTVVDLDVRPHTPHNTHREVYAGHEAWTGIEDVPYSCPALLVRFPRLGVPGPLAVALALFALGFTGTPAATADVCTGGAPYEASGAPEASVTGLVAFLASPRWSREMLPSWEAENTSEPWGSQLAYA